MTTMSNAAKLAAASHDAKNLLLRELKQVIERFERSNTKQCKTKEYKAMQSNAKQCKAMPRNARQSREKKSKAKRRHAKAKQSNSNRKRARLTLPFMIYFGNWTGRGSGGQFHFSDLILAID